MFVFFYICLINFYHTIKYKKRKTIKPFHVPFASHKTSVHFILWSGWLLVLYAFVVKAAQVHKLVDHFPIQEFCFLLAVIFAGHDVEVCWTMGHPQFQCSLLIFGICCGIACLYWGGSAATPTIRLSKLP